MPDMLDKNLEAVVDQLRGPYDQVVAFNVSECCLMIPKRIIQRAGHGETCFWEFVE